VKLHEIILARNSPFVNPERGAEIHKIGESTAKTVAALIQYFAPAYRLPVAFLSGCICQESSFDPCAFNKNLLEHAGVETFEGTDWGLCQLSGKYLPDCGTGATDQAGYISVANEPAWAIEFMAKTMQGHYEWAYGITSKPPVKQMVRLDPFFLATLAYNRGRTGALQQIGDNTICAHPFHVIDLFAAIQKDLDV
jgi:hypothetical protein